MPRILANTATFLLVLAFASGAFAQQAPAPAPDFNSLLVAAENGKGCSIKAGVSGITDITDITDMDKVTKILQDLVAALPATARANLSFIPPVAVIYPGNPGPGRDYTSIQITLSVNGETLFYAAKDFSVHSYESTCSDYDK
jgi:hypothetical protein